MLLLPKNIKKVRKYLGDDQEEFGKKFQVTQGTVSHWENENPKKNRTPDTEHLINIAKLGNVSVDWLLTNTSEKYPDNPEKSTKIDGIKHKINSAFFDTLTNSEISNQLLETDANKPFNTETFLFPKTNLETNYLLIRIKDSEMDCSGLIDVKIGDLLKISLNTEDIQIGNTVLVVLNNGDNIIRQYYKDNEKIKLISNNPDYEDYFLLKDEIKGIYKVVSKINEEFIL